MFATAVFVLLSFVVTPLVAVQAHVAAESRPLRPIVRWLYRLISIPLALVCVAVNMWLVDRFGSDFLRNELFRDFVDAPWAFLFTVPLPVSVLSALYLLCHGLDGWLRQRGNRHLHPPVSWER